MSIYSSISSHIAPSPTVSHPDDIGLILFLYYYYYYYYRYIIHSCTAMVKCMKRPTRIYHQQQKN